MSRVEVNRRAPVVGEAEGEIRAPLDRVWSLLADLPGWPRWNPAVTAMNVDGPVAPGTTFTWKAGSRIVSRLEEVDPPRRIAWTGKTMGIRAVHVWELDGIPGGTRVRTRESFDGLLARLLAGKMRGLLDRALEQGVEALRQAAEAGD